MVERVVGDPMKSAEMGRAAAARAREFGTRRVAEMYLNDFEELLAGRRRTQ